MIDGDAPLRLYPHMPKKARRTKDCKNVNVPLSAQERRHLELVAAREDRSLAAMLRNAFFQLHPIP